MGFLGQQWLIGSGRRLVVRSQAWGGGSAVVCRTWAMSGSGVSYHLWLGWGCLLLLLMLRLPCEPPPPAAAFVPPWTHAEPGGTHRDNFHHTFRSIKKL